MPGDERTTSPHLAVEPPRRCMLHNAHAIDSLQQQQQQQQQQRKCEWQWLYWLDGARCSTPSRSSPIALWQFVLLHKRNCFSCATVCCPLDVVCLFLFIYLCRGDRTMPMSVIPFLLTRTESLSAFVFLIQNWCISTTDHLPVKVMSLSLSCLSVLSSFSFYFSTSLP